MSVTILVNPPLADDALNRLFAAAWPGHTPRAFAPILRHSLAYLGAFADDQLVGFVNLAWDGGVHAFLLDPTVHPRWQRRGLGARLVHTAADVARAHGVEWLHVDYKPHLDAFYRACGFTPTLAGLRRLDAPFAHDQ